MGIAPMSSEVFPKYSTSIVCFDVLRTSKKQTKPRSQFSLAIRVRGSKKRKCPIASQWLWHRRFRIENQESDGTAVLSAGKSKRRSKCRSKCVLGFGDEVCVYHRERDIYDHALKVGLRILKVQPVESINNPTPLALRGVWDRPRPQSECSVIVYITFRKTER